MRSYYEQPRKELRTASDEIGASPKVKDELRADCADLFKMIAGTEQDADEVSICRPKNLGSGGESGADLSTFSRLSRIK
jgi:hypothetical protein